MTKVRQRAGLLISLLGALGLAVLVVRVSLASIFASAPLASAQHAPNDPNVVFASALNEYAMRKGRVSATTWAQVQRAVPLEPLAAHPFVIAGVRASMQGDGARATKLLEEARRRDPRQWLGRTLLAARYAQERRVTEMITEFATLDRSVAQARPILIDLLATAAVDRRTAGAIGRLVHDPVTLNGLLQRLIADKAPTSTILRLSANLPAKNDAEALVWQRAMLERLVDEARYDEAFALWQQFSRSSTAPNRRAVNFNAEAKLPPFDWRLATDRTGVAEITRGALAVDYFGRETGELARKLLQLKPGRYTLAFDIEGRLTSDTSKVRTTVRCAKSGASAPERAILVEANLRNPTAQKRRLALPFLIPTGCTAQWLTLEGVAADFPTSQSFELSSPVIEAN